MDMPKNEDDVAWMISSCGQLALMIEASAPKPGNVNRVQSFSDTEYRHYLCSAAQAGKGLYRAAKKGISIAGGRVEYRDANLGDLLYLSQKEALGGVTGRNTVFGAIVLLIPLTVALAASIAQEGTINIPLVEHHVEKIIENTSVDDAISFSRSFEIINLGDSENKMHREWKEIHERYDMTKPQVEKNIREDHLTLGELLRISASVDPLCEEIIQSYPLVLRTLYPRVSEMASGIDEIEEATVQLFIWLLSERIDGHVLRNHGMKTAEEIRKNAHETLISYDMDQELTEAVSYLSEAIPRGTNPGTTADFMVSTLMCWILNERLEINR